MKINFPRLVELAFAGVLASVASNAAHAQAKNLTTVNRSAAESYWTTERMRDALPAPTPKRNRPDPGDAAPATPALGGVSVGGEAAAPVVDPTPAKPGPVLPLLKPRADAQSSSGGSTAVSPNAVGTAGLQYTTARVTPEAVAMKDYRRAGKLFYKDGTSDFVCSASIIDLRLIITAAHCVYNTSLNRFHSDFRFVPAYSATLTTQPFKEWVWESATVTAGWANLANPVPYPNAHDYALIEIRDQTIGTATVTIGAYLGRLGWGSNAVTGKLVTQLGYPGNLDGGGRMIRNDGLSISASSGTVAEIGSHMGGGASGGPWISDFGTPAAGQPTTGRNRVVGVSSYYTNDTTTFRYGASVLNSGFVNLRTQACARRIGNC